MFYVPTFVPDPFQTNIELFKFRTIKLKHLFCKHDQTVLESSICSIDNRLTFRPKSYFCPQTTSASITTFCKLVEQDVESLFQSPDLTIKYNITEVENEALHNLS